MSDLVLFWHRRDLRGADNVGLAAARARTAKVIGLFCLDPHILERDDVAPARVAYLLGSLKELDKTYRRCGSQLLILHKEPERDIPELAAALQADVEL
ncbi:MAG: deoxyribodipyrimidine photo-lyase [Thermosynechococcaceae cyanobacterium]